MIKIVSDSSALYSKKDGQDRGISIIPLIVNIDGNEYSEYEDINTKELVSMIKEGDIPVTSQPSIGEVLNVYDEDEDCEIINISLADGLSGTYNSACIAKEMAKNPNRIDVINSGTLCGPQKYLVNLAVKLVELGKSKKEIVKEINKLKEETKSFLIPNDFNYLVRGGRLSPIVGKIGGMIKLVPIMTLAEDKKSLIKYTTKRTFKKAIQEIVEYMIDNGVNSDFKIYVSHACNDELSNIAKNIILENIENADIEINLLGPVFTSQGGPGCVSIQYIKKHEFLK